MNNLTIKNNEKYFMFVKCSNVTYLIDTNDIKEIIKMPKLEYPERLPKFISGLLDYRGEIINTIDLRDILGLQIKPYDENTILVVLEDRYNTESFALALDFVDKVEKINVSFIKPAPLNNASSFTRGIYTQEEQAIPILDIHKIIRRVQDGMQNNEMSDIGNILPSFDLEIYNKRSLKCKDKKEKLDLLSTDKSKQYITFTIQNARYCLHNQYIKSFYKLNQEKITIIPSDKNFIVGILNVKGEYITIIDLNSFFDRDKAVPNPKSTIIIPDSGKLKIGFLADGIGDSLNIEDNISTSDDETSYVLNDKIYYILNIQNILNNEKLYLK